MKNYIYIILTIALMAGTACRNTSKSKDEGKDNYQKVEESIDTAVHKTIDKVHQGADWVDDSWQNVKETVTDEVDEIEAEAKDTQKGIDAVKEAAQDERQIIQEKKDERQGK